MSTNSFLPMHVKALGFSRNPFPYTPDAHSYFLTQHVERQFTELSHCILERKGFLLLTSDIGLGKSTLVRRLIMAMEQQKVRCALVVNTFLQGPELLGAIVNDFGLPATGDLYKDHKVLNDFLLEMHQQNTTCLVVIDDAQNLSKSSLEMIRLLSNLETDQEKLVQILLVGQQELEATLSSNDLRQLRSRLANHITLKPLTKQETQDYVAFRLQTSHNSESKALLLQRIEQNISEKLWIASKGVPRNMHIILDRCMYGLLAKNEPGISSSIMEQAIADTRFLRSYESASPVSQAILAHPTFTFNQKSVSQNATRSYILLAAAFLMLATLIFFMGKIWLQNSPADSLLTPRDAIRLAPENLSNPVVSASPKESVSLVLASSTLAETPSSLTSNTQIAVVNQFEGINAKKSEEIVVCQPLTRQISTETRADEPEHQAHLSTESWAVVGKKLQPHVTPCFDDKLNAYFIRWNAPVPPSGFPAGREVAKHQIALSNFGSLVASDVDGKLGNKTVKAIKEFQSNVLIPVTGKFDALTVLVLNKVFDT